jgi:hypothetical protein
MILTRYAVCSETNRKPVTRIVCDTKPQAEAELERVRREDEHAPEASYWIVELGAECEAWRYLATS